MDTLIHWQWVTRLWLCASVPVPTSKELMRRSRRPARSLGVAWRRGSNTGNDLSIHDISFHPRTEFGTFSSIKAVLRDASRKH